MHIPHLLTRHRRAILLGLLVLLLAVLVLTGAQAVRAVQPLLGGSAAPTGDGHWILRWLETRGLPLVLGLMVVAAAGAPLPINLLLLAMGAAAAEGRQSLALAFGLALAALVVGDHLGYLIGWWGGRWLVRRIAHLVGSDEQLPRAAKTVQEHGWRAVFLTRWLLLPLGAPLNWVCGSLGYPLRRFFSADVLGEAIYVAIFLALGMAFSDQVESIARVVGAVGIWLVGLLLAAFVAWQLFHGRNEEEGQAPA